MGDKCVCTSALLTSAAATHPFNSVAQQPVQRRTVLIQVFSPGNQGFLGLNGSWANFSERAVVVFLPVVLSFPIYRWPTTTGFFPVPAKLSGLITSQTASCSVPNRTTCQLTIFVGLVDPVVHKFISSSCTLPDFCTPSNCPDGQSVVALWPKVIKFQPVGTPGGTCSPSGGVFF